MINYNNIEFYETDKFQYLLIHKNGCTSVTNLINQFDYFVTTQQFVQRFGMNPIPLRQSSTVKKAAKNGRNIDEGIEEEKR
mgnify:CR=1 FL=1